jgi:hypothetical protein
MAPKMYILAMSMNMGKVLKSTLFEMFEKASVQAMV